MPRTDLDAKFLAVPKLARALLEFFHRGISGYPTPRRRLGERPIWLWCRWSQAESTQHKNFGQPVVSDAALPRLVEGDEQLLRPAQAATHFQIPEYLLRKACAEGRLEHLRVVNALWISAGAVAAFAESWRAGRT